MEAILTTFLAPFLPYLLKQGERAGEAAVDHLGAAAWRQAQALWKRLRPTVEDKEAAKEAAEDVALQLQLRKLLADDPDLAAALQELLDDGRRTGVMADNGAVVIGGSVVADRGGVAAGRDINAGAGGIHTGG